MTVADIAEATFLVGQQAVVAAAVLGHTDGLEALDVDLDLTDRRLVEIATAVLSLLAEGLPVDPVSVLGRLQARSRLPWARSAEAGVFLADLTGLDRCPVPAQAGWYAQGVRAATARRRLIAASHRLQDWAVDEIDPQAVVDRITSELFDVAATVARINLVTVDA